MTVDFAASLVSGLRGFDLALPPESVERLAIYFKELLKWSKKVNLIAKGTDPEQIIENHFIDSLSILPLLTDLGSHLLDIGSGAGFPGLVCKAARPELMVTLVEPRLKRVSFLGHVSRTLALTGISILPCRVEDEVQLPADSPVSHITGRAVSEIGPFLSMVERFAPTGARVICMKGPKWREELQGAAEIISRSPYKLSQVIEHVLPFSGAKRSLLLFDSQK
ncbi:MAG: 16S rRNA (guanine(527)-N(7))-methyltransferase RsmG [Proteobacteria bacterium]|nr:16S rRNA (guanine(527)-N(7))-methyltransferase RsmG [Pseudomonadota bacterium]